MAIEVLLPAVGESVVEGTVIEWLVKEGDVVSKEQTIVTIQTMKADTEIPAPEAGRITKIVAQVNETIPVKAVLCLLEPGNFDATEKREVAPPATGEVAATAKDSELTALNDRPSEVAKSAFGGALASPDTRRAAREVGIDPAAIAGSGEFGRVTKSDVLRAAQEPNSKPALETPKPSPVARPAGPAASEVQALMNAALQDGRAVYVPPIPNVGFGAFKVPPYIEKPGDRLVPFTRRRRMTAAHMVYSKQVSPQVVTVAEIDLFATSKLREANKDRFKKQGVNLTYLAFVVHATATALKENPSLNARVLDDAFVLLRDINLGVAVDTKDGLVVPVIKRADALNVRGIAQAIDELATKARDNKLVPDDLGGASFSVTNPGLKGNLFGGAIINQPNVGILRIGEMKKRVVVVEHDGVDAMAIHPVMFMALSYDHRIVDGVAANSFLFRVREILEKAAFEL